MDDWVLCRIYKKNSSGQKPTTSVSTSSKEQSNDSSSTSHLDDMLDSSFPEINDSFFALPRVNSLKNFQNDEKLNFQNLGSGNFDWASLAGLNSVPEFAVENQAHQPQTQGIANYNSNDVYVPSIPQLCHVDEEVQSGLRTNSGMFQQNPNVLTQNYSNSLDPFGFRYPTQSGGFGFRQWELFQQPKKKTTWEKVKK